jgi:hypothetical protein
MLPTSFFAQWGSQIGGSSEMRAEDAADHDSANERRS